MSESKQPLDESVWRAYGPEKDAWKNAGNYFTPEQLAAMEKDLSDLTMRPIPRKIYDAN